MTRTRLDGYELFTMIGGHRDVFADHQAAIDKAATAILLSRMKSKNFNLEQSRQLKDAIGPEFFALALDILSDADLAKLVKKLDPHFLAASPATPEELRRRAVALASKQAEPTLKPARAPRRTSASKTPAKKEAAYPSSVTAKPARHRA